MKRIIAAILLIAFSFSLSIAASAIDTTQVQSVTADVEYLSAIADEIGDSSPLTLVAESYYKTVLPTLTESEVVSIIQDATKSNSYRSFVIDMYSLALQEGKRSIRNDSAAFDNALVSLIVPGEDLSVMALGSLSNLSTVTVKQLTTMIDLGSDAEKAVSLKVLCARSPQDASKEIEDILLNKKSDRQLYDTAINFLPRLIGTTNTFTEDYVISKINKALYGTSDERILITCVQALMEIGSEKALNTVLSARDKLPDELFIYFAKKTGTVLDLQETLSTAPNTRGATNRLGNALYRDGVGESLIGIEIDWHAGLVGHASGPLYQGGEWVIHHPGGDAVVQYDTFDAFLTDSDGVEQGDRDEFYMSSVSQSTAYDIFFTAHDLTNEAIPYTFSPMLRTSKASGRIEPSDITKIRCDGVVEYCYEYNGVRLQGPNDSANTWDISTVIGAENHPMSFRPSAQSECFDRRIVH